MRRSGSGLCSTPPAVGAASRWRVTQQAPSRRTHALLPPPQAVPDPWGVSADAWESIEANLFAVSLFPYLTFLWLLDRPETACPPRVSFAFKFLLVFVFATIPAGIYAKAHYGTILANVDWLHGTAESMLTVTNLMLVLSLRDAVGNSGGPGGGAARRELGSVESALLGAAGAVTLLAAPGAAQAAVEVAATALGPFGWHSEPGNALSVPTWAVHTSSVIEYLVAMGLVWAYADVSGNPRWKGLTWGMLPSHSGGITACVYHIFYNAPTLASVVALQASLTVLGNTTCAVAAYRIWRYGVEHPGAAPTHKDAEEEGADAAAMAQEQGESTEAPRESSTSGPQLGWSDPQLGWEDLGAAYSADSNAIFVAKIGVLSFALGAAIKYGELAFDLPFQEGTAPLVAALALIGAPTLLNISKWATLSRAEAAEEAAAGEAGEQ